MHSCSRSQCASTIRHTRYHATTRDHSHQSKSQSVPFNVVRMARALTCYRSIHTHPGPLNEEMVAHMAHARFTVLQTEQCVDCAPNHTGAEAKMTAALAQIRAVNPQAAVLFYFPVSLRQQIIVQLIFYLNLKLCHLLYESTPTHSRQLRATTQTANLRVLSRSHNQATNQQSSHTLSAVLLLESWYT